MITATLAWLLVSLVIISVSGAYVPFGYPTCARLVGPVPGCANEVERVQDITWWLVIAPTWLAVLAGFVAIAAVWYRGRTRRTAG